MTVGAVYWLWMLFIQQDFLFFKTVVTMAFWLTDFLFQIAEFYLLEAKTIQFQLGYRPYARLFRKYINALLKRLFS